MCGGLRSISIPNWIQKKWRNNRIGEKKLWNKRVEETSSRITRAFWKCFQAMENAYLSLNLEVQLFTPMNRGWMDCFSSLGQARPPR